MGILNITPDSFSDGGRYQNCDLAVEQALLMVAEGADIVDVGGESTRPGSARVSAADQIGRVVPIIRALRQQLPATCTISIDTTLSEVAVAAVKAGAGLVNDVSAGTDDPLLFKAVAHLGAPIVLMHRQGTPETMQDNPVYADMVGEVRAYLEGRANAAIAAGIPHESIIIDPGIGFGKKKAHNLQLMAGLSVFVDTGFPVLLGASRKRFMGAVCHEQAPSELLGATVATTVLGVMAGIKIFRVHDIKPNRQAADVTTAILASA